jgi:transposase InsO family protein
VHGRAATVAHRHKPVLIGFDCVHVAIDDHFRLAYVEVVPDERVVACAGFLRPAVAWFADRNVTVARVLTDNEQWTTALDAWLEHYTTARSHSALKGQTPIRPEDYPAASCMTVPPSTNTHARGPLTRPYPTAGGGR